ncbi:MAG: RNA methyltransferase, partial [bacterium]|nr:RNA methyltransferase [bacterium]
MKNNIRILLVETSHPGNIGAVARAMKNMCLEQLVLVNPKHFPSAEAISRASGADDVLQQARVYQSLDEAIADCNLVVGASARLRTVQWPQMNPRECAERATRTALSAPVAIVFGREHSGLSNSELERCQYLLHIPANSEYSSLNVAMAVQVICYEIMMISNISNVSNNVERTSVSAIEMQGLFDHLEQAMKDIGFADPLKSNKLMRRLKRLFHRAQPDAHELKILRGL